jgi:UDP-N-acetylglucosamine--N-acetylmuramyl-(pentapeptide) pyrophosphoryl-undecaprenol N-acetylglucosamine transferase
VTVIAGTYTDRPGIGPGELVLDDLAPLVSLDPARDLSMVEGRLLLVANAGGHLSQLVRLRSRLPDIGGAPVWVTSETPQSRSLLAGENVLWVPSVAPRDVRNVARCLGVAKRLLRHRPAMVVSTGSGIALGFLPLLSAAGVPAHYVESATRVDGPSLTGRLLGRFPPVRVHTQHQVWANHRWSYTGSVFEGFAGVPRSPVPDRISKVVVTVGSLAFPFDRMLRRAAAVIPAGAEVLWQVGSSDVSEIGIQARRTVPADELAAAIAEADVVIAHAGTGSALAAHEAGRCPLLITRESAYGEHIDNHQAQTAKYLSGLGLAVSRRVNDLHPDDLWEAAARQIVPIRDPGPLVLA